MSDEDGTGGGRVRRSGARHRELTRGVYHSLGFMFIAKSGVFGAFHGRSRSEFSVITNIVKSKLS